MRASTHNVDNMTSHTQYRVAFDGGSTRWFDSETEALASRWMTQPGARIVARNHVAMTLGEHVAMQRQGARIVTCSRHEIAAMARDAMKRGVAFAAKPIGSATYKVMEIA